MMRAWTPLSATIKPRSFKQLESFESLMNWYLVSVRPYKRDLFLKHLDFAINNQQLNDLFLEIISPTDEMYKDMVLIQVNDLKLARTHLSQIDSFQRIEPRALSEKQVAQFLGKL